MVHYHCLLYFAVFPFVLCGFGGNLTYFQQLLAPLLCLYTAVYPLTMELHVKLAGNALNHPKNHTGDKEKHKQSRLGNSYRNLVHIF